MTGDPGPFTVATPVQNRFDRMEVAGAFGDLGTLVPFVVAYIGVLKMDPFGVLLAFGLAMIVSGITISTSEHHSVAASHTTRLWQPYGRSFVGSSVPQPQSSSTGLS